MPSLNVCKKQFFYVTLAYMERTSSRTAFDNSLSLSGEERPSKLRH